MSPLEKVLKGRNTIGRGGSPSLEVMKTRSPIVRFLKQWTLPLAIATGTGGYLLFANVLWLSEAAAVAGPVCEAALPSVLFVTLLVTFSKVDFSQMQPVRWHMVVLTAQLVLAGLLLWCVLLLGNGRRELRMVAEAVLVCVIAPCASAAPVVTCKLGGNLTRMTTFTLLSSVVMAVLIPLVFPLLEQAEGGDAGFVVLLLSILKRMATVLLLPLLLGAVVRHRVESLYRWLIRTPDIGFYCWCVALAITSGITVKNIVNSHAGTSLLCAIAVCSLVLAVVQFGIGRWIGRYTGDHICTGQAMFQKNTGLAIWIAYTYLNPLSSIGAGCYVLWQNIINSLELYLSSRNQDFSHA